MKKLRVLGFSLSFLFLASCSQEPKTPSRSDQLEQIVETHFESMLQLYPLNATAIGDHRFDAELTNPYAAEHRTLERTLLESSLKKIQALGCDRFKDQEALTCTSFLMDLESELALDRVDLGHFMPFDQFDSFFSDFAELSSGASYVTFDTDQDYENFLKRIQKVPPIIDSMIANMKQGIQYQITTPKILVKKAHQQLQALLAPELKDTVFYKPLLKLKNQKIKDAYETALKTQLIPAYQKLEHFIRNDYLKSARSSTGLLAIPGGRAYYQALIRHHTSLQLDPAQVMEIGLKEVARIKTEFLAIKTSLGYVGSLNSFFKSLRTDPKLLPFKTSEQVIEAYRKIHARIQSSVGQLFSVQPRAQFEIREVDPFKAENASEAYQNPSMDGKRPGIFWVPVPRAESYNSKVMESLFLHEAIPGHHFQIALQQELKALPRFRRFEGNNAYVEGWALYAESLGKSLGIYEDPYAWIGRLENDMHRALRLVIDVGLHWKGWTRERAIQFSLENEPADEPSIVAEVERYLAIPAQALSYKLGEQKILELKNEVQNKKGIKFDVREFHHEILKDGPLPLPVLENKIKAWANQT